MSGSACALHVPPTCRYATGICHSMVGESFILLALSSHAALSLFAVGITSLVKQRAGHGAISTHFSMTDGGKSCGSTFTPKCTHASFHPIRTCLSKKRLTFLIGSARCNLPTSCAAMHPACKGLASCPNCERSGCCKTEPCRRATSAGCG